MSPRAACRLEQLGFPEVHDYVPGKADWLAAGLPREGQSTIRYAGDLAIPEVPTCSPRSPLRDTLARLHSQQQGFCAVVTDDNLVLGMLYADRQPGGDAATVEAAMRPGPTTVRANEPAEPLAERMRAAGIDGILVTDPEGRLLGLLDRTRIESSE
jgi:CBS domain-containing protein